MVKHARNLMKALFSHAQASSHCGDRALAFPLLLWSLFPTNKTVLVCYPTNLEHKYILNVLAGISCSLFSSSFIVFSLGLEMVTDGKAETVQLVKNWLCKYKNSGSTPRTHIQTWGHTYNPRFQEAKSRRSLASLAKSLSSRFNERLSLSQKIRWREIEEDSQCCPLHTYMCTHWNTCTLRKKKEMLMGNGRKK